MVEVNEEDKFEAQPQETLTAVDETAALFWTFELRHAEMMKNVKSRVEALRELKEEVSKQSLRFAKCESD